MILEEINSLIAHLKREAKINVVYGMKDPGSVGSTYISLKTEGNGAYIRNSEIGGIIAFPLTIDIISPRGMEAQGLQALEKVLDQINDFNPEKGHTMDEEYSMVYDDNNLLVSLKYMLRLRTLRE